MLKTFSTRLVHRTGLRFTSRAFWSKPVSAPVTPMKPVELGTPQVSTSTEPLTDSISSLTDTATVTDTITDSTIGKTLVDEAAQQLTAITSFGDFKILGMASNYTPSGWIEQLVETTYLTTGLPWWGSLICATVAMRFILLPMAIKGQQETAKIALIKPELEPINERLTKAKKLGDSMGTMKAVQEMKNLYDTSGVNPLKSLGYNIVQIPFFIGGFLAFKKMGELPVPGFSTGGIGWIHDLSAADPYYILPVLSSIFNLLSFEVNKDMSKNMSPILKQALRFAAFGAIPFMGHFPVALFLYFCTNGIMMLLQSLVLQQKSVRQYLDLPPLNKIENVEAPKGMLAYKPLSLFESVKELSRERQSRLK